MKAALASILLACFLHTQVDCPPDALVSQPPSNGPDDKLFESDTGYNTFTYHKMEDVDATITALSWWGVLFDNDAVPCADLGTFLFQVEFRQSNRFDDVGDIFYVEEVQATPVETELQYRTDSYIIQYFAAELAGPVDMGDGWIGISAIDDDECNFLWLSSEN